MYYEERWIDGWPWYRRALDGPWSRMSEDQMIARLRNALGLVIEATDGFEHKKNDLAWLRGAVLTSRAAARNALGH
jgi:hypothetical protein